MKDHPTVFEALQAQGISRRRFIKFCAVTASTLASRARQPGLCADAWQRDAPLGDLDVVPAMHRVLGVAAALIGQAAHGARRACCIQRVRRESDPE